ncbi:uncharacterized protein LOC114366486 [Ostrinia furnacalis]|uniref:uncharacterized protein LOC114366486 n=1 Tax=Ostrinia furnacalis TaxID=93504 RepID=UPI001040169C|nr:uncharacterized protein LOC114366486 [Ostrinia furnacalis]
MVEFMERKGDPSKWFSSNRVKLWATLTVMLNDIPGYNKHMEQWEQVWHTWKDHTKQKLQTTDKASLTSLEQRLLKITGHTEELINKDQSVTEERKVCETIPTEKPQPTNLVRVGFLNSFELSDEEVTEGNGTKERETKKMGHELRSRSSVEQLGVMLKYFERHGEPNNWHKQDPLLSLPEGRVRAERMWTELSATLNGVPGERKPADKWKKVWVDWKCKTKKKMLTEGMDSLSAYGRRVMAIAGHSGKPAANNEDGGPASQNASQSASLSNTLGFHLEFEVSDEEMAERTDRTDRTERTPAIYKHIEIENKVRSSYQQFAAMLEYMERHGDLVYWNMLKREAMWAELTTILNSLPGFTKTEEKWKKVWADWKCKTKRKVMKSGLEKLTDAEKRVLTVIGRGSRCDDSDSDAPNTSEPKGVYLELNSNSSDEETAKENNLSKIERELKKYGQEVRAKANAPQHLMLLEYMEKHGHPSVWCKDDGQADQLWAELAEKLNAVPGGVEKTVEKWKKAWADWKSKTKKKLRTLGPNHLSEYEVRVLTFAGRQWPGHKLGAVRLDEDGNEIAPQESQSDVVTTELYMELSEEEMESEEDSDSSDDDSPNYNERGKTRRPKYTRTTVQQHTEMLKFFGTHGHPNYWASLERGQGDQLWAELAETLNNCRGGSKHVEKWKRVWTDWKSKTRKKVAAIRRRGKKAGVSLTALQKRVHHIMNLKSDEPYVHVEVNEFDESSQSSNAGQDEDELGNLSEAAEAMEVDSEVIISEGQTEQNQDPASQRPTIHQLASMLAYMERNGDPAYWSSRDPSRGDRLWEDLTSRLNGVKGGCRRDTEAWQEIWSEWKERAKTKAEADKRLTPSEKRIMVVIRPPKKKKKKKHACEHTTEFAHIQPTEDLELQEAYAYLHQFEMPMKM